MGVAPRRELASRVQIGACQVSKLESHMQEPGTQTHSQGARAVFGFRLLILDYLIYLLPGTSGALQYIRHSSSVTSNGRQSLSASFFTKLAVSSGLVV